MVNRMKINKKTVMYSAIGGLTIVAIYYIYEYFRLSAIYASQATLQQAQQDIQNPQTR